MYALPFAKLLQRVAKYPHMKTGGLRLIILLGLFGDFDSFEYAQTIKRNWHKLQKSGIKTLFIGIGDEHSRIQFSDYTSLPIEIIQYEENSDMHEELGCSKGLDYEIAPLLNLLLMCAGVGSPGTLPEVLRGYIGDKKSSQIYNSSDLIRLPTLFPLRASLFERAGGTGFLRPFEMATLRLENMLEVLTHWHIYMKYNDNLTQRGGTFLIDREDNLVYRYLPSSLLGYSECMLNPLTFLSDYFD